MKKCLLFHKWIDVSLDASKKYGRYYGTDNYRYCKTCGKWQIIIGMRWFDCNPPWLTKKEKAELGL